MEINSDISIGSIIDTLSSIGETEEESNSDFSDILTSALSSVTETETESEQATIDLLTGEDTTIHETMVQTEKAELALELALAVRNKVIDAYNEIMQMQL